MTHDLQECINATRRAEQKVRSLTATRRQKQQLWTKWLDDMKLSYMKEQQRHQRDMERLSKELEEAIRAQEAARASCRAVAIGELAVEDEAMGDDAAGWDGMLQEWRAERADSENSDAVLRRALAAPQRLRSEGSTQQFSTPPRRGVPSMPLTPPAPSAAAMTQSTMPEAIVKDPYMTSPSHSTLPDGMEEHVAAEATASPTQQRPRQAKPRQSVKHFANGYPSFGHSWGRACGQAGPQACSVFRAYGEEPGHAAFPFAGAPQWASQRATTTATAVDPRGRQWCGSSAPAAYRRDWQGVWQGKRGDQSHDPRERHGRGRSDGASAARRDLDPSWQPQSQSQAPYEGQQLGSPVLVRGNPVGGCLFSKKPAAPRLYGRDFGVWPWDSEATHFTSLYRDR